MCLISFIIGRLNIYFCLMGGSLYGSEGEGNLPRAAFPFRRRAGCPILSQEESLQRVGYVVRLPPALFTGPLQVPLGNSPGQGRRLVDNLPLPCPKETGTGTPLEQLGLRPGFKTLWSSPNQVHYISSVTSISSVKERQDHRPNPSSPNYSVRNLKPGAFDLG